jgi:DNA gyrase subunit A
VHGIRIAGRNTQGVTLFKTAADETVVSVARIADADANADEDSPDIEAKEATDIAVSENPSDESSAEADTDAKDE